MSTSEVLSVVALVVATVALLWQVYSEAAARRLQRRQIEMSGPVLRIVASIGRTPTEPELTCRVNIVNTGRVAATLTSAGLAIRQRDGEVRFAAFPQDLVPTPHRLGALENIACTVPINWVLKLRETNRDAWILTYVSIAGLEPDFGPPLPI
jgi:hypothetical protein